MKYVAGGIAFAMFFIIGVGHGAVGAATPAAARRSRRLAWLRREPSAPT